MVHAVDGHHVFVVRQVVFQCRRHRSRRQQRAAIDRLHQERVRLGMLPDDVAPAILTEVGAVIGLLEEGIHGYERRRRLAAPLRLQARRTRAGAQRGEDGHGGQNSVHWRISQRVDPHIRDRAPNVTARDCRA